MSTPTDETPALETPALENAAHDVPALVVTKGQPDDAELAAVLAVVAAAGSSAVPPERESDRPLAGGWRTYHRTLRRPLSPGPGAWQNSMRSA